MSDLFEELLKSVNELPISEGYTPQERYNDFRQLFTGSDQGKRVYKELLSWGKLFNPSIQQTNPNLYHAGLNDSNRNFSTRLMAAVNIEPPVRPTKATRKPTRSKA